MRLSFLTLQRGNAGLDALRRKRGRGASGKACDAERRTIVAMIVPHAPAWECRSRRFASSRGRGASGTAFSRAFGQPRST
ncbi:DUF1534 domain-containing protein [Pseudomonas syringae UB303]|uniref:DUF1534 domain-containing protein n=1 Tax=Pseudomonas syringae UB303 TaxID=1357287 RepID=A0AAJ4E5A2_PSESX|nr:DUF1534 domain-containing protein [Pseudomonas syringae UB303]